MSTRATYSFKKIGYGRRSGQNVTFYIHHDGYPSGAAFYLFRAINHKTADRAPHESLAERFLRANDRAELTTSHDAHGDTEYRYSVDIKSQSIVAESIDFDGSKKTIFDGSLVDFVNKYGERFCAELCDGGKFQPLTTAEPLASR